jgi:hypothetical protein
MTYYAIELPKPWANIEGKPYITVSAKGIVNGLSDIPNDGADFGPDTPGTQTSGIQEAWNYASSFAPFIPDVVLSAGNYIIHQPLIYKVTTQPAYSQYSIVAPGIVGTGGYHDEDQTPTVPMGVTISAADDFPTGEYAIAYICPDTAFVSGATNPEFTSVKLMNFNLNNNNRGAGIFLANFGDSKVSGIGIFDPTYPNPNITKGLSTAQQNAQTGAFVYTTTSNSGEYTEFDHISIRGSSFLDGFVLQQNSGPGRYSNLWMTGGAQRYGFRLLGHVAYSGYNMLLENPECDMGNQPAYTGTVPTGYVQSANYVIEGGQVTLLNPNMFLGSPNGMPYIFIYNAYVKIIGGTISGSNSPTSNNLPVIYQYGGGVEVDGTHIVINSAYYGIYGAKVTNSNNGNVIFRNISILDLNSGNPASGLKLFNINWGNNYTWYTVIEVSEINSYLNNPNLIPLLPQNSLSLQANPPVSGTVYQNRNPAKIKILLPVYASTSGTAGSVSVAMGNNSSNTNPPTIPTLYTKYINGGTSSSSPEIVELTVPAGWYYSFTGSGVTFGTATVLPA